MASVNHPPRRREATSITPSGNNATLHFMLACTGIREYAYSVKIALIILHADVARGGAERYTLDLASSLVKRGHDVSVLASSFQNDVTSGERVLLPANGLTRTGRYLQFLDAVDAHLAQNKYDITHAMLPVRRCDVYHPHAGVAAASSGNLFQPRRKKFAAIERELLTSSNPPIVLCLSQLIQGVVEHHYPQLQASQLVSLFNGTDLVRFNPADRPQSRMEVRSRFQIQSDAVVGLILAQDFERKGLRQAIEALARVDDSKLMLLVGGKQDPAFYQRLAESLNVQDRVIFAGPVSSLADFYRAADFFILPTRFDPCSLVVLEALAMGLPVISTVKNGACEIMQNKIHGYILINPDDILAITEALREMLDTDHRVKLRQACMELRPALSQERHLAQLESIYNRQVPQKMLISH